MLKVFYICFFTGVLYTAASFILGQIFDFLGLDGDVDMDGDLFGFGISPLKPIIIAAFVTVFGGVGIIAEKNNLGDFISLLIALISALAVSFLIFRFILVPLYRLQSKGAVEQKALIGHIAKVTLTIKDGQFGKIIYVVDGYTYSAPAKAENNETIEKGSEVVIVEIKNNAFYVKKL
ncbi:NfeD family protein [Defluviitalea saccharophila]|uniref:NfeD family protein n=1 Tax=Defluviitalea saccharophila TaxID=879970 RepID=A0ABZ2Y7I3_9FIRM